MKMNFDYYDSNFVDKIDKNNEINSGIFIVSKLKAT